METKAHVNLSRRHMNILAASTQNATTLMVISSEMCSAPLVCVFKLVSY